MNKITACPFCGNSVTLINALTCLEVVVMPHGVAWVKCHSCSTEGPTVGQTGSLKTNKELRQLAIAMWNQRLK
jgi:hypothetical protein